MVLCVLPDFARVKVSLNELSNIYPLELSCDVQPYPTVVPEDIMQRPRREAAEDARRRIRNLLPDEEEN